MGLRISIDLDDNDLKHFRLIMRESRKAAAGLQPEEIIAAAQTLLQKVDTENVPKFIRQHLHKMDVMITMLTDHEWRLPQKDSLRVLNALAYFSEPQDLIPDHIPGLGFLDDAIMIELVARDLKHEVEAYGDFCEFRSQHTMSKGIKSKTSDISRERWLEGRRDILQSRMRRRRKSDSGGTDPQVL